MKRLYYINKIKDKILIKVIKLNKNLNIIINSREVRASIRDYLNTREIHI